MAKENHSKFAILGLLTTTCNSGYEMKQMIDTSLNHFWKISYGQIYPTLKKLVDEGLAFSEEIEQEHKPAKKVYVMTDLGKAALQDWLEKPIEQLPVEKNELLLKLFFSNHQQDKQTTILHINDYVQKLTARLQTYQMIEESIRTHSLERKDAMYWLITLDYGIRTTQGAIDWGYASIKKVEEEFHNG
ncbi:PadR family transcriptional regulator [Alkalihalobacillus pseudalcaliphilus]|uniref:PadR family transcriptional regulator n=1 Tax=Alkalihalobacillus pseudalcaliphilus TaxID=79884 RepID=UPI00064DEDF1|nr:PadR family transcriptional regulator [Alkalihalobacillus pseudalcaliphilus]KMK77576.1 transcriptional regulator [Alkalihalobacillus pseudalcaliphilus]